MKEARRGLITNNGLHTITGSIALADAVLGPPGYLEMPYVYTVHLQHGAMPYDANVASVQFNRRMYEGGVYISYM